MYRFMKILRFAGWPAVCGVLAAVVLVQYRQLDGLARSPRPPPALDGGAPSFADAIGRVAPSVVGINATSLNVGSVERASENRVNFYLGEHESLGSGVVVSEKGFILTNLHVIDTLFDAFDAAVTLSDGRTTKATVVAWDEEKDLAVLHVNMDGLTPIRAGDDARLRVGDVVFAIGYPRNIGQSVSQGIVSALIRDPDAGLSVIQTDAAINPGNSGGALIDGQGRLVGLSTSIFSESGNFEGIGFATPASVALAATRDMVGDAVAASPGYLGVLTGEALDDRSSRLFFGVDHIRGMLVESVDAGSAAERADIRPGDVITAVEGSPVTGGQNIMMEIRNKKPGEPVTVQVYRDGLILDLPATLGFGQAVVIELDGEGVPGAGAAAEPAGR